MLAPKSMQEKEFSMGLRGSRVMSNCDLRDRFVYPINKSLIDSHHGNMPLQFTSPYTPLLYNKTGVYRGINYFIILVLKHILWVLV